MKQTITILTILIMAVGNAFSQTVIKGNISTATGKDIVNSAMEYIGTPYRYGTMNPTRGFDCSGFTSYVFKKLDITLPRTSRSQYCKETAIDDCRELKKAIWCFSQAQRCQNASDMSG